ncbi:protein translocase subunit SecD [Alkaliphilus sp. MSJ-5]|uniref:Protein translocase subunit SecD n=1 Tax=Alkaliphilus flagellatus TaxID=2841507 RepID=A0ABS6G6P0_9FIRM|nr:protein translocase subunit SecD [Alkaliphilus flagellatus]MBU5677824.1 protein translocase subunit SecD [Alkaliphilus flagellatus]
MKAKSGIIFIIIIAILGLAIFTAFNGLEIGNYKIKPVKDSVRQGLDLKGGVYVLYEAQTDKTGRELDELIEQVIEVFSRRVDSMGLTEPLIIREGEKRIRVELPGAKNAQEAIDMIGKTAQLKFVTADDEVVVTGSNVVRAQATLGEGNSPHVSLEFDSEGAKKFAEATGRLAELQNSMDKIIYIILDDEVISSPVVNSKIPDGHASISGGFTIETASNLAALIRAGALPVDLEEVQTSTITATLGENALNRSLQAAKVGIILVFLFMLIYYRIPGLVAGIALSTYILLVIGTMITLKATFTLPSIAALILSVGMAVDANVIIFERIKEEIKAGKTVRAAIDSGFKRAFTSILDSNITTLISGIVLYQFGTGPIRGFAVMLIIGIVASMFTAVVVTKFLLKLFVGMNLAKNSKLYGA